MDVCLWRGVRGCLRTDHGSGMAGAHSKELSELWVSIIEKGYAKYYGSYAMLRKGFVHHALRVMAFLEICQEKARC